MQMTAIIMKSRSGGARGQEWEAPIEHAALSLFPKDFGEALSVMKVRGGKQLENCCNLAGNVI